MISEKPPPAPPPSPLPTTTTTTATLLPPTSYSTLVKMRTIGKTRATVKTLTIHANSISVATTTIAKFTTHTTTDINTVTTTIAISLVLAKWFTSKAVLLRLSQTSNKIIMMAWLGLVSLLNGISTFVGYLMSKSSL